MGKGILFGLAVLAMVLAPATQLQATDHITLTWTANTKDPEVISYLIYYGTASRTYGLPIEVPGKETTTHTITGLDSNQTYYLALKSYDSLGQPSDKYSEELVVHPRSPATLAVAAGNIVYIDQNHNGTWDGEPIDKLISTFNPPSS
ncbi:fibronectin type III domain-containing protein, partial [Patescibacteria group bacterium]